MTRDADDARRRLDAKWRQADVAGVVFWLVWGACVAAVLAAGLGL